MQNRVTARGRIPRWCYAAGVLGVLLMVGAAASFRQPIWAGSARGDQYVVVLDRGELSYNWYHGRLIPESWPSTGLGLARLTLFEH